MTLTTSSNGAAAPGRGSRIANCLGAITCLAGALAVASVSGQPAFAAESDGAAIAANGTDAGAPACASCHGEHGEGQPEGPFPRLAGINAHYLVQQLQDFASGKRASDLMGPIAMALSDSQMNAVATYYAKQSPPKAAEPDPIDEAAITAGETLAERGDWTRGLPGCAQCHGPGGVGVGSSFPKLAGQSMEYITGQLKAWQDKQRANDPLGLMANVAFKLSDKDVTAVASYYASLPAAETTTSGENGGK
ncbi:cytochrome c [Aurantimonas sp. VKM B-3413]|uniref:c-type cytochrome n=1 Tax=Aurantimonas sp. VKM B-3413 TaxID=2779401 RepID=UPI001E571FA3|nr:c-type cytochrome [Aurantimonas sp. VKM B-3413]MCB8839765.1 cytochrome c4 [Aurantimonas sp. VKM B-3413]